MINYFFTEFGFKKFLDSISSISEDQYNFKNTFSSRFGKSRFALNIGANSKSQFFKHLDYKEDSTGIMAPYLFSSYLSPGYKNFTAGIKYEVNPFCILELGLVNGKRTRMKNQSIYDSRKIESLYGLYRGQTSKLEYGINLVVTIPAHEIAKNLYLENFSQFNVNKSDFKFLKYYKLDVNNAFHYKILKHFRLSLRTKCLYDCNISEKIKLANSLTIGFYLNNTF